MTMIPTYKPDETVDDLTRMRGLIDFLSAYIEQYHGGWVRLLDFDGKTLTVEMGGACAGCALSPTTLHGWVEGTVRQFFPHIESVRGVEAAKAG